MTTADTTSTGMPPIAPGHDALDTMPAQHGAGTTANSFVDESKAQLTSALTGVAETVRELAHKLGGTGAAPLARYVHGAADSVAGWSNAVESKSVTELLDDTRTLVRTSPAVAVGVALAAGFAVSRLFRAGR